MKQGLADLRLAMFLGIPMSVGAISASLLAVHLSDWMLMTIFGLLFAGMGAVAFATLRLENQSNWVGSLSNSKPDRVSAILRFRGSYYDSAVKRKIDYEAEGSVLGIVLCCVAGLAMVMGAGAGVLAILVMAVLMKVPIKIAIGTSRLVIGVAAVLGSIAFFQHDLIRWRIATPAAMGTSLGALLGSLITNRLSAVWLRAVSASFLVYMGYMLFGNGLVRHFGVHLPWTLWAR